MGAGGGHVTEDFGVDHGGEVHDGFLAGGAVAAFGGWLHVVPVFMAGGWHPELDGFIAHMPGV